LPLAAAFALAYLPLAARPAGPLRSTIKTLAVGLLALICVLLQGPGFLIVALGLCALGDWLLSRDTEPAFRGGIAAFGLGHLAYVVGFLRFGGADTQWLAEAPQVWAALGLAIAAMACAWVLLRDAGGLRLPVILYIPVLLGMGYAAIALPDQGMVGWAMPAAMSFIASDLVLGIEAFVLPARHWARRFTPYVIWPLYWGAQAGFVVAII